MRSPIGSDAHAPPGGALQGKDVECEILNFRRDGAPLINNLYICPLHSDPQQPEKVTHFLGLARFRLAKVAPELLGPLPERPPDWVRQDTLSGDSGAIPVPSSWASGGAERDAKDWLGELGDREVSHLMGFLSFQGLAALGATCRRFRRLAAQDHVWKSICQRVWGAPPCSPHSSRHACRLPRRVGDLAREEHCPERRRHPAG